MEEVLQTQSHQSINNNSILKSIKIDHCSIVDRFDSMSKKTTQENIKIEKRKLLTNILTKKRLKILRKAVIRWNVRKSSQIVKNTMHQVLMNAPVSKVIVFYRLFHSNKNQPKNQQKTLFSLIDQKGEESPELIDNVLGYLSRRRNSALVEMAKLHDSLSVLNKQKQRQIMDNIRFKISEAEFACKNTLLKNSFQSINNSIKNKFQFFKDVRIKTLLKSILKNKQKQYFRIWFVKVNQAVIPSNISSIKASNIQKQPSLFWAQLLQKPSQISKTSQISCLGQQSKLKENSSPQKEPQGQLSQSGFRKMFADEQPKRNFGGLLMANSYSYFSQKQSLLQKEKKKKDLTIELKHMNSIICSIIKMRLFYCFSQLKQCKYQKFGYSKKQQSQTQNAGSVVLFQFLSKKVNKIERSVFQSLLNIVL